MISVVLLVSFILGHDKVDYGSIPTGLAQGPSSLDEAEYLLVEVKAVTLKGRLGFLVS